MFQTAQAWLPQFNPPLPLFRTSRLELWFEKFAAALGRNGICIQEFMYNVLEYYLPRDRKRRRTHFSWSSRPYDDLRDAVLKFYGLKRAPPPTSDTTASSSLPSRMFPTPQALQTVPLPTMAAQITETNLPGPSTCHSRDPRPWSSRILLAMCRFFQQRHCHFAPSQIRHWPLLRAP